MILVKGSTPFEVGFLVVSVSNGFILGEFAKMPKLFIEMASKFYFVLAKSPTKQSRTTLV